jgi:hypothetical protein
MIVIVIINMVAIYGVWKSNAIVYYQITPLSEQKYRRLAIPFAENNFGPFKHIAFVIVLFESPLDEHYHPIRWALYAIPSPLDEHYMLLGQTISLNIY